MAEEFLTLRRKDQRNLTPDELSRLGALATLSAMLNASIDVDDVLRQVIDIVIGAMEAERGFVMLDRGGEVPEIMVARGLHPEVYTRDEFLFSRTIVQRVLTQGQPVISVDAIMDPRFASSNSIRVQGTRSILCVPMRIRRRILGVIYLDNLTTAGIFTAADLDLMGIIADLSASAIDRTQYVSHLVQSEKMAALGTLVAGIAHELNNPLTAIAGFAQLFGSRATDPESLDMAELIQKESARCGNLIRELLSLARQGSTQFQSVDLLKLIEDTVPLVKAEYYRENVELRLQISADLPRVGGSPDQLRQVLLNLLTNARLAVKGLSVGRVVLRASQIEGEVVIQVSDNGPGISPANLRQIFDPFFTTRPQGEGTGLGLSLVQRIVSEHGGTIRALNNASGGAMFVVELPPEGQQMDTD